MTTTEFDLAAYKTAQQRDWTTTAQGLAAVPCG
jgi:hypothetical protein